ncbi:hypothetical protein acsn021_17180 [Anaerocolumna cellulosilytica]|uniref:Serine aminopeptidase S33 domain-containing protein n=1 Tax=Anaerocolumna cellulosilytica TaxID=433286 RepID=A0A6S6QYK3_9FIRM|nr:alpha/beta fold hydrolase [Anaerocolumna cellulosilytica]MBB5194888.1 pimeloyl-ACP methyl ester carboxylesterase/ferritin-like protein [Anaerocolumna cellulosilytica]BCJ94149.1 hypothetical protein acsn021_17180 [Anaerocolumna cellulosilytica]
MKKNILFTGIYDLFGLKLASALYEQFPSSIYYFGTKENLKCLNKMITDSVMSVAEKEYLTAYLKKLTYIEDETYFTLMGLDDFDLDIWHMDNIYPATSTYNLKTLNFNKNEIHRIERICKAYKVKQIHYLSSIYRSIDDYLSDVALKIKEMNEEYILQICKNQNIKGTIYRTPIIFKQTGRECESDYISLLTKRIDDFVKWIKGRIPNYFDNYKVNLLSKSNSTLHIFDVDSIIEKILDLEGSVTQDLIEIYHICTRTKYSTMDICKKIFKDLYDIDADLVDDISKLTAIDKIFHKIYTFHIPYLHEKTDDAKRTDLIASKIEGFEKRELGNEEKRDGISGSHTKILYMHGDNKLTYHVAGSGQAILIVNAYGVNTEAWDSLVELLSQNYYVIYWRSRGLYHDEKKDGKQDSYCGVWDLVEDIEQIVLHEKLSRFHIMSWCSGAKAAIFYNLKHPDHILSQIFIAGEFAPFTGSEPYHSKFRENIQLIADLVQNNERMLDFYMKIIHKGMFNHPVKEFSSADEMYIYEIMPEEHRNVLLSPFTSKETMVNFLMMCMEYYKYDVTEKLKSIKVPTLFISAECDQVAPYMQSKWAHSKVGDSSFVCFPSGTHLLILERTSDVYDIIMQHMKYNNFSDEGKGGMNP